MSASSGLPKKYRKRGVVTAAAGILGIDKMAVYNRLKRGGAATIVAALRQRIADESDPARAAEIGIIITEIARGQP